LPIGARSRECRDRQWPFRDDRAIAPITEPFKRHQGAADRDRGANRRCSDRPKLKRTAGARRSRLRRLARSNVPAAFYPGIGLDGWSDLDARRDPRRRKNGGQATAGPRPAMAGGRPPIATGQPTAAKPGSCVMTSQPVPELTGDRVSSLIRKFPCGTRATSYHRPFVEFDRREQS
jgi:hypothetical protein